MSEEITNTDNGSNGGTMSDPKKIKVDAIENIKRSALPDSPNNVIQLKNLQPFLLTNSYRLYNDGEKEKNLVLHHLSQKFKDVKNTEDILHATGKNLLYFSVFYQKIYIDLLEISLKSIVANTPNINFDVLIITDSDTKLIIEKLPIISSFNVDYMIMPSVDSAPMASMSKIHIFDYPRISEYSKILFLDSDTICIKDLNILFSHTLKSEKLYVSYTPGHLASRLLTATHGLMYLTKENAEFLYENTDTIPFNAGQFMFLNSTRMKMHFDNIRWLQVAWPGQYFYEQGFMNYYFIFNLLCEPLVDSSGKQLVTVTYNPPKLNPSDRLQEAISEQIRSSPSNLKKSTLIVTGATRSSFSASEISKRPIVISELTETEKLHDDSTVVMHFAAVLPSGKDKKAFITVYADAHKLHI
jgi:hypothetical protein